MPGRPAINKHTAFLRHVNTHGFNPEVCWEWLGAGKGNGYGQVRGAQSGNTTAHRRSFELFCGQIPDGLDVCHSCDNRFCVNPDHLFAGTRAENMADMKAKGRGVAGCRKHLKEATVQEIRRRLNQGVPMRRISDSLNVNYATVTSISRGDSYVGIGQ